MSTRRCWNGFAILRIGFVRKLKNGRNTQKRFPAMLDKKIFLSIDEYAYGGGSFKSALAYGMMLNEMFRHTEFMKMAAYTMSVSTLDYNSTAAVYNSRGFFTSCTASISGHCRWRCQEIRHNRRRSIRRMATSRRPAPAARLIRSTWWLR